MAKYIITERQHNLLAELQIPSGKYETNPLGDFFGFVDESKRPMKIAKLTRKYLEKHVGLDTSNLDDDDLYQYVRKLRWNEKYEGIPKYFYKVGIISGLSYYFAKSLFDLSKGTYGLSYFTSQENSIKNYWFFDSEIKDFVGRINLQDDDDFQSPSYKINLSAVDPLFIGKGYGSKMYLTILNDCEYLISDTLLYKDSLNIWTNVLPKYVNVWARRGDEFLPIKKKFVNPENIKYYVASKKHNTLD